MKKGLIKIAIIGVLLFLVFSVSVSAAEEKSYSDGIIEDFEDAIPTETEIGTSSDELIESFGFDAIMRSVIGEITSGKNEFFGFLLTVIGFCILSVLCESISFSGDGSDRTVGATLRLVMSLTIYPKIHSIFLAVKESLDTLTVFLGAALPAMTAITAGSGAVKSAAVQAMNMNITLGIIGSVASRLLLPLSFALLALALTSSISDGISVGVGKGIKSLFTFGLGIVTAASSAAIALQSVVAGAADSAALRAARYAAGGLIPVVGSSVSGALSTLAGGLAYAKSTIGAASIGVISVLCITPLILLLIYRMVFSLGITLMEYMDNGRCVRCFSAYRTAMDAVISVYVMSTLVCIIQVILFIKGGVV